MLDRIGLALLLQIHPAVAVHSHDQHALYARAPFLQKRLEPVLAYARHRKTEGYDSAGRERAQQRILKAVIDKLLSMDGISSLSKLFDIIPSYVITNMPSDKIAAFARAQLEDMRPWAIESLSLENGVNTHMMLQASLNDYSDAYVFSRQDVQYIEWAYESNEQRPKMSSFSFNLSDIAAGTKQISDDGSLVWSDQVIPY